MAEWDKEADIKILFHKKYDPNDPNIFFSCPCCSFKTLLLLPVSNTHLPCVLLKMVLETAKTVRDVIR